jgi:NodT family efflux transporter outer membrane factor (OMF) lipoprotein
VAALLAACTVGPDYHRPEAPVPAAWKEQPPVEWKTAEPRDHLPRGTWWAIFGDPGLDALEAKLDVSNQTIAQAEAQYRASRAVSRGARASFFPTVGTAPAAGRAQGAQGRVSSTPDAPASTVTTYQLPVDAAWEADLFGKLRRTLESSVATEQATGAQLEAVRLAVQAQLAADWFLLRGLDSQRQLLATTITGYGKALELTENRHRQGVVSGVDVALAKTQLEATRAQLTDLSLSRAQLEHAIAILVGTPPSEFSIPDSPTPLQPPVVPLSVPSGLLEMRPDIASAERRMAAANAQIGVAAAAYYPSLVLSAAGGFEASTLVSFFSLPNRFWSLGAALAQTLFDGGRRRAVSDQALAAYDATVATYRGTVLGAFQEVEDGLAAVRMLQVEAAQQAEAVAAAEKALSLAQSRYRVGVTTYLEVVAAQAVALSNERTAVELATRRLTASVNLVRALGGGWNRPSD